MIGQAQGCGLKGGGVVQVLYVDDNELNRKLMRSMLEAAGIPMAEAENAEAGLALIGAVDFDLVLMDLRMPGMDGLAAIRKIRARRDAKAHVPIIVVTAETASDIRRQAEAAGADDLLHKPVQIQTLFETVSRVLAPA
ncbi:response regulator [Phenylobacterium sp.]|uniref:response regulator n=1 Tax=Phenylobacterium sp. TaxID=1871053 RepID=UPI00281126A2|nr:response regulator [Phenylobacterium sp.]